MGLDFFALCHQLSNPVVGMRTVRFEVRASWLGSPEGPGASQAPPPCQVIVSRNLAACYSGYIRVSPVGVSLLADHCRGERRRAFNT